MKQSKIGISLILFFIIITVTGYTIAQIEPIGEWFGTLEMRALLMGIVLVLILLFLILKSNKVDERRLFYKELLGNQQEKNGIKKPSNMTLESFGNPFSVMQ